MTDLVMSDDLKIETLDEASQQFQDGLKACHELVAEYRAKLAANGNEPPLLDESDNVSDAARS